MADQHNPDLEASSDKSASHLNNDLVQHFSWSSLTVTVKDRKTKKPIDILFDSDGFVEAGQMLAIMGPSGSGKTTLLNALAHRQAAAGSTTMGSVCANGQKLNRTIIRKVAGYVEQEEAMIGSLTVKETIRFAAGLALPDSIPRREKDKRVSDLIESFGLREQSNTIVGTVLQKGLSGGQKKRLGIASRLVTAPKIIFLDEPTSGLDSTLSFEVISHIRTLAKRNNLIVIASIHQPSTTTFNLFDKLCLLSKGRTAYFGDLEAATEHFSGLGYCMSKPINPAEFFLDLINTDLAKDGDKVHLRVQHILERWSQKHTSPSSEIYTSTHANGTIDLSKLKVETAGTLSVLGVLLARFGVKAYRDVVVYSIRVAMYLGLAILMGTVFLRFGDNQRYIQPYINAIFFGGAFMSFMAVAYVPAFLEDHATFVKDRANGLVGAASFMLANFIIGLPFLFLIAVLFSVVTYFLIGFHQTATSFWLYVTWLYLDLLAAESLVVLVSSIAPNFVISLAITAFANGLWMCVDGFLVPLSILNVFWKYVFHYIDYQAYVFQGMMNNEFLERTYDCDRIGGNYICQYPSPQNPEGKIDGVSVLSAVGVNHDSQGKLIGIMIGIIVVYRFFGYLALKFLV